jgi:hypothetical protein
MLEIWICPSEMADKVVNELDEILDPNRQRRIIKEVRVKVYTEITPIPKLPGNNEWCCFFIYSRQSPL